MPEFKKVQRHLSRSSFSGRAEDVAEFRRLVLDAIPGRDSESKAAREERGALFHAMHIARDRGTAGEFREAEAMLHEMIEAVAVRARAAREVNPQPRNTS